MNLVGKNISTTISCFLLIIISNYSLGQDVSPIRFNEFRNTLYFVNPAFSVNDYDFRGSTSYNVNTGISRKINTSYIDMELAMGADKKNHLGLTAIGDREGFYIRRNRAYLKYASQVHLSEDNILSLGTSLGFVNHFVKGNQVVAGASDFKVDGALGVFFINQKNNYAIGVSSNQYFNSKIKLFVSELKLARHYNILIMKEFTINDNKVNVLVNYLYMNANYNILTIDAQAVLAKAFVAGVQVNVNNDDVYGIGTRDLELNKAKIDVFLSYRRPMAKFILQDVATFEVGVTVKLNKTE